MHLRGQTSHQMRHKRIHAYVNGETWSRVCKKKSIMATFVGCLNGEGRQTIKLARLDGN